MSNRFGTPVASDFDFRFEIPADLPKPAGARRHPLVYLLALGMVVETVVAIAASIALIAGPGESPQSPLTLTAKAYLAALARGDAASAWTMVEVADQALPADAIRLVDEAALAALLADPSARVDSPGKVSLLGSRPSGRDTDADFSYGPGAYQRATLTLRSSPSGWKVVLSPGLVNLDLSAPAAVQMDGRDVPEGSSAALAVLPGNHRFAAGDGHLFEPLTLIIEVRPGSRQMVALDLRFTASAIASVARLVAAALDACSASPAPAPASCPQSVAVAGPVQWRLLSDGIQATSIAWTREAGFEAAGRFQYIATYRVHTPEAIAHAASTGGYRFALKLSGGAFAPGDGGLRPSTGILAQQPAVDGAAIRAAVADGLAACAASTLLRPPDCPNGYPSSGFVTPVSWRLESESSAQAEITFDSQQGAFTATGTYLMTAAYTEAGRQKNRISSGAFVALFLADGSHPVLVGIRKAAG